MNGIFPVDSQKFDKEPHLALLKELFTQVGLLLCNFISGHQY